MKKIEVVFKIKRTKNSKELWGNEVDQVVFDAFLNKEYIGEITVVSVNQKRNLEYLRVLKEKKPEVAKQIALISLIFDALKGGVVIFNQFLTFLIF
jgi:hypothetical protein